MTQHPIRICSNIPIQFHQVEVPTFYYAFLKIDVIVEQFLEKMLQSVMECSIVLVSELFLIIQSQLSIEKCIIVSRSLNCMYVVVVYLYSIIIPDNSNEFTGTVVKKRWGEFQITLLILETLLVPYGTIRAIFFRIFFL